MTQGELLKIMAETVAEYQNCILEVVLQNNAALVHLIPCAEYYEEEEDEEDERY